MTQPGDLINDGQLIAPAIATCTDDAAGLLAAAGDDRERAAACAVAAIGGRADLLLPLLDDDGLCGRIAAWGLGQTGNPAPLIEALPEAGLDRRANSWLAICHAIANGASVDADAIDTAILGEIERHAQGRAACGETACRALVILGDSRATERVQAVSDADRFCDRFELQRLRKLIDDEHARNEELRDLSADWAVLFADEVTLDAPASAEPDVAADEATDNAPVTDDDAVDADGQPIDDLAAIDWEAFMASPEAEAVPEEYRSLVGQLGPAFEQLAARFVGKGLTECSGDEIAALFLQVLPQALPPQYVQVAISPQGLAAFKAIGSFLNSQEAESGSAILDGITVVREQIKAQMRASGSLNSSMYDEA